MTTLAELNALDADAFAGRLGHVFEHSPWIARAAHARAPFASLDALHAALMDVVRGADEDAQLALLRAHPELARREPLTAESAAEQHGLGLDRLAADEAARFEDANRRYHARFGFPFIIAVRGQRDRRAILAALEARLGHAPEIERAVALEEVGKIARFRLRDLLGGGRLTTHVLDTAEGRPAAGLALDLYRLDGEARTPLGRFVTNADGRCDAPLLQGEALRAGDYELVFHVGTWRAGGFYESIPIRFRIADPTGHFHVPLILAPFGYSTYRGS